MEEREYTERDLVDIETFDNEEVCYKCGSRVFRYTETIVKKELIFKTYECEMCEFKGQHIYELKLYVNTPI